MRKLFAEHGGDRERVLDAYAQADQAGLVRRTRNDYGTSSREYAIRLWANGVYHSWLDGSPAPKSTSPKPSKVIREVVPLFEEPLIAMGLAWEKDASRPHPTRECLEHWTNLVEEWVEALDMPLLVRKTGLRGILTSLSSGRGFIRCDNSPAHWSFMGCLNGKMPSLSDIRGQLEAGQVPIAMAPARPERALFQAGSHQLVGGYIGKSLYGQVRNISGRAYKLCHLRGVGLKSPGEVETFSEQPLREHMKRLLDPANMIVVPIEYSGVGECAAFLRAFIGTESE